MSATRMFARCDSRIARMLDASVSSVLCPSFSRVAGPLPLVDAMSFSFLTLARREAAAFLAGCFLATVFLAAGLVLLLAVRAEACVRAAFLEASFGESAASTIASATGTTMAAASSIMCWSTPRSTMVPTRCPRTESMWARVIPTPACASTASRPSYGSGPPRAWDTNDASIERWRFMLTPSKSGASESSASTRS